jgi:hypothetical protein
MSVPMARGSGRVWVAWTKVAEKGGEMRWLLEAASLRWWALRRDCCGCPSDVVGGSSECAGCFSRVDGRLLLLRTTCGLLCTGECLLRSLDRVLYLKMPSSKLWGIREQRV